MREPPELTPALWRDASRALLVKLLAEWSYEELLSPEPVGGEYRLDAGSGVEYRFRAARGALGAWSVSAEGIRRNGEPAEDPLRFVLDVRERLGLDGVVTSDVIAEIAATLTADARLLATALPAARLADLDYAGLEGHQTGHPCMALNKGRLGFSASDLSRYAPEAREPLRLQWIAAAPELGSAHGIDQGRLLAAELDPLTRRRFAERAPAGTCWLPVHPWHWDECVLPLFAAEVARGRIVALGEGSDRYLPLQSVRTLTNLDAPGRHDVKLPLMIRNTLVWRGLSPGPTAAAPAVTAWLQAIRASDPFLREDCDVVLQGEVASVVVAHPQLAEVTDAPYRCHELLGAVWREPVRAALHRGERARTMAALLQVGADGRALAAELVARSGLEPRAWLERLLRALLWPLLHFLYRYGVAFCPHGENTTIVYRDDVPVRIALKDFAEDVNLCRAALPEYEGLPPEAGAVLLRWEPEQLCHSILSAVFAGHFRFFSRIAAAHLGVPEAEFWGLVRAAVDGYQRRFPALASRFAMFDLLAPTFGRVCLNREQLLGGGFHDRADRDAEFDLVYGRVANPLAGAC